MTTFKKEIQMNKKILLIAGLMMSVAGLLRADGGKDHAMMPPPYVGSKEFEQMKKLAGTWEGSEQMGENPTPASAVYEVTSNGSVVLERLFPGTSHEMVTTYYDQDGKLAMTHYCAVGNRPVMELKSATDNQINLSFSSESDIDANTEGHMHDLTIDFVNDKQIVQHWTMFEEGKKTSDTTITLSRK